MCTEVHGCIARTEFCGKAGRGAHESDFVKVERQAPDFRSPEGDHLFRGLAQRLRKSSSASRSGAAPGCIAGWGLYVEVHCCIVRTEFCGKAVLGAHESDFVKVEKQAPDFRSPEGNHLFRGLAQRLRKSSPALDQAPRPAVSQGGVCR